MRTLMTMTMFGVCVAAGAANGQCAAYRYGVPDFDQRRFGLEDLGAYHCAPASCLNWLAYIANHGQPQAMGHVGDWQSQSEYNFVTARMDDLGDMMGTNSIFSTGTNIEGAVDGLVEWCDDRDVGPMIFWAKRADDEWAPTPNGYLGLMLQGALIDIVFGRWYWDGGEWERDGGHFMSLTRVTNVCDGPPSIGFRNPNNDGPKDTQDPFHTGVWGAIYPKTADWDGDYNTRWTPDQSGSPRKVLDAIVVIHPLFTLTGIGQFIGKIRLVQLAYLNNGERSEQTIEVPDGARIINAMHGVDLLNHLVLIDAVGSHNARLFNYDQLKGDWTLIDEFPETPRAMTTDRFGHAIVECDGSVLKYRYSPETGASSIMEEVRVSSGIAALCVDDKSDDIYGLSASPRALVRFPGGALTADHITSSIPATIPLGGELNLAWDPVEGRPWIGSEGSSTLYQLAYAASSNAWVTDETLNVGNGTKPRGLQIGDAGRLAVIVNGEIGEFERDEAGRRYVPEDAPAFKGIPADGFLFVARSRVSYDRDQIGDPKWSDILPYIDENEVLDCLSDYNVDDFVNGDDFDLFVADFESGDPDADVNSDGFVSGDDFDLFVLRFEEGC